VPDLPYLGGIGPVLWRQLTTALRGLGRVGLVFGIVCVLVAAPMVSRIDSNEEGAPGMMLAGMVVWLTFLFSQLVPFDFRGDVDRIATLKTLPLAAWRLTLGQLLAPVLLITAVQWTILLAVRVLYPEEGERMLIVAAFAPPFNFLLFAVENLLFLRFPVRAIATTPGDFQAMGRNLLLMLAKMAALLMVAFAAAITAVLVGLLSRFTVGMISDGFDSERAQSTAFLAGGSAAWLIVLISGIALVPLIARAFNAFDVGRDTPA
jgi:hypothetical protein